MFFCTHFNAARWSRKTERGRRGDCGLTGELAVRHEAERPETVVDGDDYGARDGRELRAVVKLVAAAPLEKRAAVDPKQHRKPGAALGRPGMLLARAGGCPHVEREAVFGRVTHHPPGVRLRTGAPSSRRVAWRGPGRRELGRFPAQVAGGWRGVRDPEKLSSTRSLAADDRAAVGRDRSRRRRAFLGKRIRHDRPRLGGRSSDHPRRRRTAGRDEYERAAHERT